ncbi:MAG: glycosyl transferase family A [Mesorhizobium sp. SCN 65-12]|nr:MAG: glycosyl transferase family A [Mesorhizobium sp. SCN 65-12]
MSSATAHTTRVDICVCTYRRPYLEETLRSLAALELPAWLTARVVVADNDTQPSARALVETVSAALPFEVRYVHCPASNISLARNACLDAAQGDFLAFIDDDSTVAPHWLAALVEAALSTGADVVLGPVKAVYAEAAPGWMRRGDFHSTEPVHVEGEIRTGYSGNVLLDRSSPRVKGLRFDLSLGRSGGEDTQYFSQLHGSGGRIAYAAEAVAFEPVTRDRARFSWLAKRRFRSGQTHGRLLAAQHALLPQACLASAKASLCFAMALGFVALPGRRNRQFLRGLMHVGVVSGLLGLREIHLYGDKATKGRTHAA